MKYASLDRAKWRIDESICLRLNLHRLPTSGGQGEGVWKTQVGTSVPVHSGQLKKPQDWRRKNRRHLKRRLCGKLAKASIKKHRLNPLPPPPLKTGILLPGACGNILWRRQFASSFIICSQLQQTSLEEIFQGTLCLGDKMFQVQFV
jgi:hypothetical protein